MMLNAEQNSVFPRPAAAHALTYTWIEEGEKDKAFMRLLERYIQTTSSTFKF